MSMNISITYTALTAGGLLLAACGSRPTMPAPAPEPLVACPSQDFPVFLDAFAGSAAVQEAFTRFPLHSRQLRASGRSDPVAVDERLSRSEVHFPLVPPREQRRAERLVVDVGEVSPTVATATMYKRNTDYQVLFRFVLNGCWRLEGIDNRSL